MTILSTDANSLLTVEALSQALSVPIQTIYYWVSRNDIPYIKVGRHNRFVLKDVLENFSKKTELKKASKKPFGLI